jgi:hypothetical protein
MVYGIRTTTGDSAFCNFGRIEAPSCLRAGSSAKLANGGWFKWLAPWQPACGE